MPISKCKNLYVQGTDGSVHTKIQEWSAQINKYMDGTFQRSEVEYSNEKHFIFSKNDIKLCFKDFHVTDHVLSCNFL